MSDGRPPCGREPVGTAPRVLNAVPAVCAAPPGVLSVLDLPLVAGRGLVRSRPNR